VGPSPQIIPFTRFTYQNVAQRSSITASHLWTWNVPGRSKVNVKNAKITIMLKSFLAELCRKSFDLLKEKTKFCKFHGGYAFCASYCRFSCFCVFSIFVELTRWDFANFQICSLNALGSQCSRYLRKTLQISPSKQLLVPFMELTVAVLTLISKHPVRVRQPLLSLGSLYCRRVKADLCYFNQPFLPIANIVTFLHHLFLLILEETVWSLARLAVRFSSW